MATEYRVPKLMWEAFESSLNLAGRNYVKRLANILEVPEKDLLRDVFKTNKVSVCIHDWTDTNFMCEAHIINGVIKQPCVNAKVCGSEYCSHHSSKNNDIPEKCEEVMKLGHENMDKLHNLWKREDNIIVDTKGDLVGYIKNDIAYLIEE